MIRIAGIGEVLWDMLPQGKQLGGAPANFAYHCRALAPTIAESYIISAIGNDKAGLEIIDLLKQLKINSRYLNISEHYQTGLVNVSIDQQGLPSYTIEKNVAWDYIPAITDDGFLNNVNVVCFGSLAQRAAISQTNIKSFLSKLPAKTLKIFDINLRQSFYSQDVLESSLQLANIVKVNDEELPVLARLLTIPGDEKHQLKTLAQKYQLSCCILTKGEQGSLLYYENKFSCHPGIKVKVKDTIGAGDAFTAAIAISLINNFELDYMHDCANQVAAYVCSCVGATPVLPQKIISLFNI